MSAEDQRHELHAAIQDAIVLDDDGEPRAGVLVGWALVTEWMADDGKRWLTKINGNPSGEALPTWQENGYLYEALHTVWAQADE